MIHQADLDELAAAMGELDGKEREVVRLRFGLEDDEPLTLQEIGERLRLSRERVRQIESRAKEKLRRSAKLRYHLN
jgi:RNA polymerase sigma factor (sigma-70 family)